MQPLYIPVYSPLRKPTAAAGNAPTFRWKTPTLSLTFKYENQGIVALVPTAKNTYAPSTGLAIGLDSMVDLNPTMADITRFFGSPYDKMDPVEVPQIKYNPVSGSFEIKGDDLTKLNVKLFNAFGQVFTPATPPTDVPVARAVIRLKGRADRSSLRT